MSRFIIIFQLDGHHRLPYRITNGGHLRYLLKRNGYYDAFTSRSKHPAFNFKRLIIALPCEQCSLAVLFLIISASHFGRHIGFPGFLNTIRHSKWTELLSRPQKLRYRDRNYISKTTMSRFMATLVRSSPPATLWDYIMAAVLGAM